MLTTLLKFSGRINRGKYIITPLTLLFVELIVSFSENYVNNSLISKETSGPNQYGQDPLSKELYLQIVTSSALS